MYCMIEYVRVNDVNGHMNVCMRYFSIIILGLLLFLTGYALYEISAYATSKMIEGDYKVIQQLVGSVEGYFLLLNNH